MAEKIILCNGTQAFVVDPTAAKPDVLPFCAVSIELNEGEPSKIDVTTLCETEKVREVDGLLGSSSSTITINFDPQNAVHQLFMAAKADKRELVFRIGASDGTGSPEWNAAKQTFTKQTDRTHWDFSGQISAVPLSFAVNSALQPQVSINMTSPIRSTLKVVSPTPTPIRQETATY